MKSLEINKPTAKQTQGKLAEDAAVVYLQEQGLKILQRNFLCKLGEIDLIAQDANSLVFIEVRFRKSAAFGGALASVTPAKQAKLRRAANYFLFNFNPQPACRFDVVALTLNNQGKLCIEHWVKNAF